MAISQRPPRPNRPSQASTVRELAGVSLRGRVDRVAFDAIQLAAMQTGRVLVFEQSLDDEDIHSLGVLQVHASVMLRQFKHLLDTPHPEYGQAPSGLPIAHESNRPRTQLLLR